MRGANVMQEELFTVKRLDEFVPPAHPLRTVRDILNAALARLDADFYLMYASTGRDSIAPEKLLRALMLQALYGIRSERALCEHLNYNMLYRWFVGIPMHAEVWDHSSFTRNRDRLIPHDAVRARFDEIVTTADRAGLLSDEHFSVDGTLIRAWASHKSIVPRDGMDPPDKSGPKANPEVNFKGQTRTNDLAVDCDLTPATGTAERKSALKLIATQPNAKTLGADKNYDTHDFVRDCRTQGVTPHVAQNTARPGGSAIDARTTRHAGYALSQNIRKRIETLFGDGKQHRSMLRQLKVRGLKKAGFVFTLVLSVTNLVRMAKLIPPALGLAGCQPCPTG